MRPQLTRASGIVFRGGFGMLARNTPQKTLESWKQIAAYLDRSERTVRRWEASEGLPVHRHEHEKQDTVFAFRHEIEAWSRLRTRCPSEISIDEAVSLPPVKSPTNAYLVEHDVITRTMHRYIAGAREGNGDLMRRAFHPSATISGTVRGSNIPALLNTCSSGSLRTVRHRISVLASHVSRSSRASPSFIWRFKAGPASWLEPKPELPTYSPCSSGMASGRSRISSFTGTANDPSRNSCTETPARCRVSRGSSLANPCPQSFPERHWRVLPYRTYPAGASRSRCPT